MQATQIDVFDSTVQKSYEWVRDLAARLEISSIPESYRSLRSVLLSLRDQLDASVNAHFASQLPMILRGMYFDGWSPERMNHVRDAEQFLELILTHHQQQPFKPPREMARGVYDILCTRMSPGEIDQVMHCLAEPVRRLFTGGAGNA